MKVLFLRPISEYENTDEYFLILQHKNIEVLNIPIFKISCLPYFLSNYDYEAIAFTSRNSVLCFKDYDILKKSKVYAIGEETADLLIKMLRINPVIPDKFTSISLAEKILKDKINNVLAVRSKKASDDMKNLLKDKIKYDEIYVYDLEILAENVQKVIEIIRECKIDAIALTSSMMAKIIGPAINPQCQIKVFSIGPMTTDALKRVNNEVKIIESKTHSIKGIVETILMEMEQNG
ncbi:uroporphyrinogen-III synthase [Sulfolobus tengchongensis]|uniref:Uroporphyrinogen-III synthase n=1 Tax=Sulfolobus tengchongensis TaxID=207809 RepID=A0AAX4L011_9CREN